MKLVFVCIFVTVVAASRNHQHYVLLTPDSPTLAELREHQDTNGFYAITHSVADDISSVSAQAGHKANGDILSNGLYSYVDASDIEQTGGSIVSSPAPAADINCAPEPVTDTPEVTMAKLAHFEAYREAALLAAMQPDTDELLNGALEGHLTEEQVADLQQNTRELLITKQNSRNQLLDLLREHEQDRIAKELGQQQQNQLIASYILTATAEAHAHSSSQGGQVHAEAHVSHPGVASAEAKSLQGLESVKLNGNAAEENSEKVNGNGKGNGNGNGNGNGSGNGNGNDKAQENGNGHANGKTNGNGKANGNVNGSDKSTTLDNGNGNGHRISGNLGNGLTLANGNGVEIIDHSNNKIVNGNSHSNGNGNGNGFSNSNSLSIDSAKDNGHVINHGNGAISISHGLDNLQSFVLQEPIEQAHNEGIIDSTYYTVDTPDTHYTVVIPPTIESIQLGSEGLKTATADLPLAKSFTYITQRLKSSNNH